MHMCVHIHSDMCRTALCVWVTTHICMPACGVPMSAIFLHYSFPLFFDIWSLNQTQSFLLRVVCCFGYPLSLSSEVGITDCCHDHQSFASSVCLNSSPSTPLWGKHFNCKFTCLTFLATSYVSGFWKLSLLLSQYELCCHVQTLTAHTWITKIPSSQFY